MEHLTIAKKAEFGTFTGLTASMEHVIQKKETNLHFFDSFEGLSKPNKDKDDGGECRLFGTVKHNSKTPLKTLNDTFDEYGERKPVIHKGEEGDCQAFVWD